jgi:hypothetical protein
MLSTKPGCSFVRDRDFSPGQGSATTAMPMRIGEER